MYQPRFSLLGRLVCDRRTAPVIIGTLLLPCLLFGCTAAEPQTADQHVHGNESKVLAHLDFRPFTSPISTAVLVDREVRSVRYSQSRRLVNSVAVEHLTADRVGELIATLQDPELVREVRKGGDYRGSGLTRGDQFSLGIHVPTVGVTRVTGFLDDAPEPIQRTVTRLLELADQLEYVEPTAAYIRGTPVPTSRLKRIRERGLMQIIGLDAIPDRVRETIDDAMQNPGIFYAIPVEEFEHLSASYSHGQELIVDVSTGGYQIALYGPWEFEGSASDKGRND